MASGQATPDGKEKASAIVSSPPSLPFNDVNACDKETTPAPSCSTEPERARLSQGLKWGLLSIFALAMFVDIWSYSAFFIFTSAISDDLGVGFTQQSWVITSYACTFAAFLLFWGRVSDLYSARPVFVFSFVVLGLLNLVISFLPDKFSFFVLRGISGAVGAALIPSAYRLIAVVFDEKELPLAFTLYGLSGILANVTGFIVSGVMAFDTAHNQLSAWRMFFRLLALAIIPGAALAYYYVPHTHGDKAKIEDGKWKRLDLVGCTLMLCAILLLILGLTLGASAGWKTPGFLAPFLLSWVLFPAFFWWETTLGEGFAILPPAVWRIPNVAVLIGLSLYPYAWWGCTFLPLIETYMEVEGEPAIIAALRLLPVSGSATIMSALFIRYSKLLSRPRWPIAIGLLIGAAGHVLCTRSQSHIGSDYWKFIFTGCFIGSAGMQMTFTGCNIALMTSCPPEMAGVAGALLQVGLQVGSVVGLSVQAGMLTVNPGSLANFDNVRASFYFEVGWALLWLVLFLVLYRPAFVPAGDEEAGTGPVIAAH